MRNIIQGFKSEFRIRHDVDPDDADVELVDDEWYEYVGSVFDRSGHPTQELLQDMGYKEVCRGLGQD